MSELLSASRGHSWWWGLRQVALHVVITLLALGIAFSLPVAAQYILYQWSDVRHPRYDFDTRELVYSDAHGRELRRNPSPAQER